MPNGKPGDHPYTDITIHGLTVFGEYIDPLVVRLHKRLNKRRDESARKKLADLLWDFYDYDVPDGTRRPHELLATLQAFESNL